MGGTEFIAAAESNPLLPLVRRRESVMEADIRLYLPQASPAAAAVVAGVRTGGVMAAAGCLPPLCLSPRFWLALFGEESEARGILIRPGYRGWDGRGAHVEGRGVQ